MGVSEILLQIDFEIAQLQRARELLSGRASSAPSGESTSPATKKPARAKRNLTPEGRKRISEAVKRRWAAQKKAASGK